MSTPPEGAHTVEITDLVYEILSSVKSRNIVPLGSAFPSPLLFPLDDLRKAQSSSTRKLGIWSTFDDLPPGNERLRRQVGKRYLIPGAFGLCRRNRADEWRFGGTEFLPAGRGATWRRGGRGVSHLLRRAAVARTASAQGHRSANASARGGGPLRLAHVLKTQRPKACWLMTNFQNPLGCSLSREKKHALVDLLSDHEVPLIEDDVYGELHHSNEPPSSAKTFDQRGLVMHCSSFSKTLSPGYRVGWVAAGRFANSVRRLKLMTSLSGSIPSPGHRG